MKYKAIRDDSSCLARHPDGKWSVALQDSVYFDGKWWPLECFIQELPTPKFPNIVRTTWDER